jgi:hypothetical protein
MFERRVLVKTWKSVKDSRMPSGLLEDDEQPELA